MMKMKSSVPGIALPRWALLISHYCIPLVAFTVLAAMLSVTSPFKLVDHADGPLEIFAHHLGHEINSIWVGISLIALVLPSLWKFWRKGESPIWAWRALDAVLLDFICVDALGKNLLTGLERPGGRPGFPSGHATMAFLVAWLIWQRFPKLGAAWFAIATLIAWSRVEVHAHFAYQVLAGAALGMGLAALTVKRRNGVLIPQVFLSDQATHRVLASEKL